MFDRRAFPPPRLDGKTGGEPVRRPVRRNGLVVAAIAGLASVAAGAEPAALRVRLETSPGPFLVGQGIELIVAVAAFDQRPTLEFPQLEGAELWKVSTSFRPLNRSQIGPLESGANLFLTRCTVVPLRSGTLVIPPITARLQDLVGRSRPLRLSVEPPPAAGRPAEFLGGVGPFSLEAEIDAPAVRVGEELIYRIRVAGPAAWGTRDRPDLTRTAALAIAPRLEPLPDEFTPVPPTRTFAYRLRPTRAGSAVLPPVRIAAFDPQLQIYITKATRGLPVSVVETPPFDPESLAYQAPPPNAGQSDTLTPLILAVAAGLTAAGAWAIARRRARRTEGPRAARNFARQFARKLARWIAATSRGNSRAANPGPAEQRPFAADLRDELRAVTDGLVTYAAVGTGRPQGALTPPEAELAVRQLTGSDPLGRRAALLIALCDQALYGGPELQRHLDAPGLVEQAQRLFSDLGRSRIPRASQRRA